MTPDEALQQILSRTESHAETEFVALGAARDRILAEPFLAGLAYPLFDNSAVDGYAVRVSECRPGAELNVEGVQAAGAIGLRTLSPGANAVRIYTGATIPLGAEAVLMQEDTEGAGERVTPTCGVEPGENIRRRGSEVCAGQILLPRGGRLNASAIGLLASQGVTQAKVIRRLRVRILTTGDELQLPGESLREGSLYNSNGPMLLAMVQELGCDVEWEHVADDPDQVRARIAERLDADFLIISGGVSVGDRDWVKPALAELGIELGLWRVAMKPGKPLVFAQSGGCSIFGLPGNPVSTFVTFRLFVRAAMLRRMGASEQQHPVQRCFAAAPIANPSDRTLFVRGIINEGTFRAVRGQASNSLAALATCNGMVAVPPGGAIAEGEQVDVLFW